MKELKTGYNLRLTKKKHYKLKMWCMRNKTSIVAQLNKMIDELLVKKKVD